MIFKIPEIAIIMRALRNLKSIFLTIAIVFASLASSAQSEEILLLQDLINEDRTVADALVVYPRETLIAILEASEYPELLVRLDGMQSKTQRSFRNLIETYDRKVQESIYEMVRYEGLIKAIASGGKKSKDEMKAILANFPDEIHETAVKANNKHFEVFEELLEMNRITDEAFQEILGRYDEATQAAVQELVKLPEILTLLIENMAFTVVISDVYGSDPEWLLEKADSLSEVLEKQSAQELEDYEKELKADPEAYSEMLALAEQYAKDNDIKDYKEPVQQNVKHTVVHHYPYWYGYPYWYTSPLWAPYPWYYNTGFYFGPGGGAVFIGFPSPFYVSWHYRYYPNRYYRLNSHYCRHHYRYPNSYNSFHRSVNVNVIKNTTVNINRDKIKKENFNKGDFSRDQLNNKLDKTNFDRSDISSRDKINQLDNNKARDQINTMDVKDKIGKPETRPTDLQNKLNNINQKPSQQPSQRPTTKPTQRPVQQPSQRPSTQPTQRPVQQPSQRPSTQPTQRPVQQPAQRPTTKPSQRPVQQPAQRPSNSYQNYKGNNQHNQSWSRPSSPSTRPAAPVSRPTRGGRIR